MGKSEYPIPIEAINGMQFKYLLQELGITYKNLAKYFGQTNGSVYHRIERNTIRSVDVKALREIVNDDEAFFDACRKLKLKTSSMPKTNTELKILVEQQEKRIEVLKARIDELEEELEFRKKKKFKEKDL